MISVSRLAKKISPTKVTESMVARLNHKLRIGLMNLVFVLFVKSSLVWAYDAKLSETQALAEQKKNYSIQSEVGVNSRFDRFHLLLRGEYSQNLALQVDYAQSLFGVNTTTEKSFFFMPALMAHFYEGWQLELAPLAWAKTTTTNEFYLSWGVQIPVGYFELLFRNRYFFSQKFLDTSLSLQFNLHQNSFSTTYFSAAVQMNSNAPRSTELVFSSGMKF